MVITMVIQLTTNVLITSGGDESLQGCFLKTSITACASLVSCLCGRLWLSLPHCSHLALSCCDCSCSLSSAMAVAADASQLVQ